MKILQEGIKESNQYVPCYYFQGEDKSITVYSASYADFGSELREIFDVKNDSDTQTDYFCKDNFNILPDHPFFSDFISAIQKKNERLDKRIANRKLKRAQIISQNETLNLNGKT